MCKRMFENLKLISFQESKELYNKQSELVKSYFNSGMPTDLIRISLLQTISPICDYSAATDIMIANMSDDFDFLIIGAYFSASKYECNFDAFLKKLNAQFFNYNKLQKSIVKFLNALQEYNKGQTGCEMALLNVNASLELCDDYPSNYYLKFLISRDPADLTGAQKRVKTILLDKDINKLSVDDLIDPYKFINEHILMNMMSESLFKSIFENKEMHSMREG